MKTIISLVELVKKLKKNNLLTDGHIFYLSDFHKSKVGKAVATRIIKERIVEPTTAMKHWFENEWSLRKPVGEHNGVAIFYDNQRKQFFFAVKKGVYDIDTYEYCVQKLDYLKNLGEKLK